MKSDYYIPLPETITRVELIDKTGRTYIAYSVKPKISIQDNERTMKVFIEDRIKPIPATIHEVRRVAKALTCQHKSDGLVYTSKPPQSKCRKCGEFYR